MHAPRHQSAADALCDVRKPNSTQQSPPHWSAWQLLLATHPEALEVQRQHAWQAAQHMVDAVFHILSAAAFARLLHRLVL
jgi:hypothetical protein